jgi:hypothetical protein
MQPGEEPRADDVLSEITTLLATAYQRRARIRLVHSAPEAIPSTVALDKTGEPSLHGMTLTRRREESHRS